MSRHLNALATLALVLLSAPAMADVPKAADLTHLTYTATSNLSATLVAPENGSALPSIATKVVVSTVLGAGVEVRVNGEVVPASQIGLRLVFKKTGETRYEFYGVVLSPGPNTIELTPLGANDTRGPTTSYTVYGPGRPVRFTAALEHPLQADGGKTVSALTIVAIDRWEHPAMPGTVIKVSIISGDVRLRSLHQDPGGTTPVQAVDSTSLDVPVPVGAVMSLPIVAGMLPGQAIVQITSRDAQLVDRFYVNPTLRKPIVTGLVTAGAGSVPGFAGQPAGVPDGQQTRKGRVAMFATGVIGTDILGTAAYDTANVLQQQLNYPFVDNPYSRPYQTYGDESYNRDDALSTDHLYARFDRAQSHVMWGEFRPDSGSPDPNSSYNVLINGAKVELGTSRTRVVGFDASNNVAFARQVLQPSGLSLVGQTLHPSIVVGSDVLTLVALDSRTGAVLSQTTLIRSVDYTLDYSTGLLRFINIPLPFDDHFNPQVVLVQYEYTGPGVSAQTTGLRASALLDPAGTVRAGAGYVNDSNGASNFVLYEENVQGTMPGGAWNLSHVVSRGVPANVTFSPTLTGATTSLSIAQSTGPNRWSFGFATTSSDFSNPFGGFASPGLTDWDLQFKHAFNVHSDLALALNSQTNAASTGNNQQTQASGIYHRTWGDWLALKLGVQTNIVADVVDPISGATLSGANAQTIAGLAFKFGKRFTVGVENLSNIGGGTATPSEPAQTLAQLSYAFPGNSKFYVRERWSELPTQSFAGSTSAFTTVAQATQSLSVGFEKQLSTATAVDSDYTVDHTNNGPNVYSAFGVREKFNFGKGLNGDAFAQRANQVGSGMGGFFVYGVNTAYTGGRGLKAAASLQIRSGAQPGSSLTAGAAGPLGNDFAVQASVQQSHNQGVSDDNDQIGLAWRPSHNDRGATLFEYDHRIGNVSTLSVQTDAVSIQQVYRPVDRLELAARAAYKLDGDAYYAPHTSLIGVRADERISPRYDVGAEFQLLTPAGIPGAQSTDFAVENGYRIGGLLRLAVGYNFAGSADPTLTGAPVRRGAYVTLTGIVDRIGAWGRQ